MNNTSNLKEHLLIAMPSLTDPNFHKSVTYIYEHTEDGAVGIVINKPMRITLGDVLRHLNISPKDPLIDNHPVLSGGPIAQEQGFIILPSENYFAKDAPIAESDHLVISSSKAVLESLADGEDAKDLLISLGYSSWSPGQLEKEIVENSWLIAPLDLQILFSIPFEKRWYAAAASIGVDLNRLSNEAGHA